MKKYLLANLDDRPLYRTRQIQALCYVSLIANVVFDYMYFMDMDWRIKDDARTTLKTS